MKKTISLVLLLAVLAAALLPVSASFANPPIVDDAAYLMQFELEALSEELETLRRQYDFEVAICTESELSADTAREAADDIYDYSGYGAGENDNGILFYIARDTREYHFTTHGDGLKVFNNRGLAYLESKVLPHLQNDDYYGAFETYAETAEELLQMAAEGTPYNKRQHSTKQILLVIALCLLVPLLIAFLRMRKKLKMMRTAVENDYAANYIKQGSMNIQVSRDLFLYSRITKTERPKSSSGTHTSSSGRTHGGRGGSF